MNIEQEYKRSFKKFIKELRNEKGNKNLFCDSVYPIVTNWLNMRIWIGNTSTSIKVNTELLSRLESARRRKGYV